MADYSYQIHSAEQTLNKAIKKNVPSVLAGTPGCGKTVISHIIIHKYIQMYPNARVLVLTHGQNLLKNQYLDSLKNPMVEFDFSFGEFNSNAQVKIGLPHSIKTLDWDKIDLLVVDECHEFYLKKMVQNIIRNKCPRHQILLTGSPSEFNGLGEDYEITYVSGEDLVGNDVFSSVEMDVVKVLYRKNAKESVKEMLDHAKRNGKDLSKIMIAVRNISEANNVSMYLKGIGRNVALSTCKNDRENVAVKNFKNNKHDTLVVVQRGILGFSDNNITGMFDVRCSDSVDISNQLFARVLRKHPRNIEKFYYRCGMEGKDFNNQVIMLHKVKSMMRRDIFTEYNGVNMVVE